MGEVLIDGTLGAGRAAQWWRGICAGCGSSGGGTRERLAADAGIDRAYLGGLERRTENPTVDILDRVAAVLEVPLAELFAAPEPGATPPKPLPGGRRQGRTVACRMTCGVERLFAITAQPRRRSACYYARDVSPKMGAAYSANR